MKTPMQEMLEYVQEEVQLFGSARQSLISKIKQLLEKEEEVIIASHINGQSEFDTGARSIKNDKLAEQSYNETFNTKEK